MKEKIKKILIHRLHRDNGLQGCVINYLRLIELQITLKEEIDITLILKIKDYLKDITDNKDKLYNEIIEVLADDKL